MMHHHPLYPPASQVLHPPLLANPLWLSNTYKCNNKNTPGRKLVFSLSAANPAVIADTNDGFEATSVCKSRSSFVQNFSGFPIQEEPERLEMDEKNCGLRVQTFVNAIRALPHKETTHILNILEKDGVIGTISGFNDLLMALYITNEPDLALKLNSHLPALRLVPDSWTFSITLRCHCKRNDIDEARKVLDHMLEKGFKPNVATFTVLIHSLCKNGKLQKAFEVFEIMERTGCKPTVQTFNCLLKGLCYVGRVEEAFELLVDIKKSSTKPDIYTYTAMMDGFCKVGRSNEAKELLNEALQMGLMPTAVTFNTLFDGYRKEGRPLEGIGVFKQMKEGNCTPDYISYSTLLHGLLIWGEIRAALRIYEEMVQNGFEGDDRLMNNLLRGLCRKSFIEKDLLECVRQVFDKMKKRVSNIDCSTYALVIKALCLANKADEALLNLHEIIKLGYLPRVITMNRVIRTLCGEGKVNEAFSILVLMYKASKVPSKLSYDLLIHELNRQGRSLGARNVYAAALVRGVLPHKKPQ